VGVLFVNYKDYQNARDAAWRILLDCGIDRLPVDLNTICCKLKVKVLTYGDNAKVIERAKLNNAVHSTDGMTFYAWGKPVILFDERKSPQRARFTISHELGHIILGHVKPGKFTVANREPSPKNAPQEQAANQFAARLLAPACILWALGIHTPEEIMELCRISRPAAEFRADRLKELYHRNRFLTSSLERKVYSQFQPFIKELSRSLPGG